jgi:two-component system, OmpR family, sensor histidine kinase KdpD
VSDERDAFDRRPTADEMLARVRSDASGARGRLRVYLGMAPGVGKTYTMLEEAHRRVARGTDLVVGFVEDHGRPSTRALLDGLEIVPRRHLEYRGVVVEEMDTEAILARRPTVALVDELAHTNVPGSAREKRWQDVEILRDAGINVVSTCNVQHVASVADAVATITGAPVNERLPDDILAAADEVELVDMSPHALRQRMRHGNVYPPERTQIALDRFFTEPNLTALRELSLRFVAQQVDDELGGISPASQLDVLRAVGDRVVVAVDDTNTSQVALRRAARLASAIHGQLIAVVVTVASGGELPFDRQRDLRENLDFAEDLGAEIVQVEAADVASGLVDIVRRRRASHLFLPHREVRGFGGLRRESLADAILRQVADVEVHLVADPPVGR